VIPLVEKEKTIRTRKINARRLSLQSLDCIGKQGERHQRFPVFLNTFTEATQANQCMHVY
jgi:hypothetical protein